jgi:hypothetical protein
VVNELGEDLDRALRTVTFSEAPIERVKRDGRRIRTRRRVTLLAGVLAVAAVAAGYPALARNSAAPPAPAAGHTTPPASHDPVVTDGPPSGATSAAGGLTSKTGVIASGAIGGARWQVTVRGPGAANPVPADPCFTVTLSSPAGFGGTCNDLQVVTASALPGAPAVFTGMSEGTTEVSIAQVVQDVTYFIVTFTDGQQLKLIPVTAHGHRYVTWIAPASMTVASVVAHLGGPYNDSGQTTTAVPFDLPGQMPVVNQWLKPGQSALPRAVGVVGAGTTGGHAWRATAYVGPWGTCVTVNAQGYYCLDSRPGGAVQVAGPLSGSVPGLRLVVVMAPESVAKVTVTLSAGRPVTVRPAAFGSERLAAFAVGKDVVPTGWTEYDASGARTGASSTRSGSATSSASP